MNQLKFLLFNMRLVAYCWGKSSMIKRIENDLRSRNESDSNEYVFVKFNTWLYQGYNDARAALKEVVTSTLATEA